MTQSGLLEVDANRADQTVARAMQAFEVTLVALNHAVDKLQAEFAAGEDTVMKDLKAMNTAFLMAMKLEEQARETAEKQLPSLGVGCLNLDEARDEIGLRLACLRSAGDN